MKSKILTKFFLCCTFFVSAKTNLSLTWNSNVGVYEVYLQDDGSLNNNFATASSAQIALKLPTENLFAYDIQSQVQGIAWKTQRYASPKECPDCDFLVFSLEHPTSLNLTAGNLQKLFTFKVVGPIKKGFLELSNLRGITCKNTLINVTNLLKINNIECILTTNNITVKAPIISNTYSTQSKLPSFNLYVDYLMDEVNIHTNWMCEQGVLYYFFYDTNGQLKMQHAVEVAQGAQHFKFPIESLPAGTYFVKAKFSNSETILNDGFIKKGDETTVSN
jgi:hypothetical protein